MSEHGTAGTAASQLTAVTGDLLDRPEELRARLGRDGYLYLPVLLPPDDVLRLRQAVLDCCRVGGWLVPRSDVGDGRVDPTKASVEPEPAFLAVYREVQRLEAFHSFAHHPALLGLIEAVLGEPGLPHPAKIARLSFPQNTAHTTPAHQDYPFIQGAAETFTTWIPLGDCPSELGGLEVNARTHVEGIRPHHLSLGAGAMGIDPSTLPDRWLTTGYKAGDVLVFHSHTVHRATPNLTRDRLRVSVDFRYQARSLPIAEGNLLPHTGSISWPEVYQDWNSTELQYYWTNLDLTVVSADRSFVESRDNEAFERAAQGDPIARPALLRIAQRDRDPERRERAVRALAGLDTTQQKG
jgi:Phytanoyl-CoA dioxygenase (PhyH)